MSGFTGFFIEYVKRGEEIGARFGRIFFRLLLRGIEGCQEVKTGLEKEGYSPADKTTLRSDEAVYQIPLVIYHVLSKSIRVRKRPGSKR